MVAITGKKDKRGGKDVRKPDAKQKAAAKEKDRVCSMYICIYLYTYVAVPSRN